MATKLIKLADGTLVEAEVPDNEAEQISWKLAKKVNESFDRIEPLLVKVCKPIASAWGYDPLALRVACRGSRVHPTLTINVVGFHSAGLL
jgi:hypothetical protein